MKIDSVGIIGGGAWGTGLAQTLRRSGRDVLLWAREAAVAEDVNTRHCNDSFLPGVPLDSTIHATNTLSELSNCDVLLMVAPAQHVRAVCEGLKSHICSGQPFILCAKGIEQTSGKFMGDVLGEVLPEATQAVLSGPSFAVEVARGLPAALTIACADEQFGRLLAQRLSNPQFRLYWTNDLIGVELGGAVKNVLAIAAGIVDGQGLGANAHAALVTRGFAELRRFGEAMGARPETLIGLSGLGDLILTCASTQSRNMSLGRALGQGRSLDDILSGRTSVTEGVYTAAAVQRIAKEKDIDMPICAAVSDILDGRVSVSGAIARLMQRPLKAED